MGQRRGALVALVLGAMVLGGCTAEDKGSTGSAAAPEMATPGAAAPNPNAAPEKGTSSDKGASSDGGVAKPQSGDSAPAPVQPGQALAITDRKLARSATLSISSGDVGATVQKATQIALAAGGYTGQERTDDKQASLSIVVPAEKLDQVLAEMSGTGEKLLRRELQTKDVTEEVVDVESRLTTQRASVDRVRGLLGQASSISEITSVERELTSREAELESLQGRQKALAGSVAMGTISLNVSTVAVGPATVEEDRGFVGGLAGGWDAFLDFGAGLLTVVGAVLPFAVLFGVPLYFAVRYYLRRRASVVPPESS
ncbi:DUF4349 domain-containing protein [Amycolatopsis magusensis]|uniref:DUF4349 domain-containing protein n=1 Tax=Amycolatopsis magusensis TaxID=882444 RepID=UPI0024A7CA7C|nr:DUF4349 domain-containing protein [Amycolatopsis magusensis]MDI5981058.1 DUF4349 domain-containing protein [Amycolatopsis magusensis]